MDIKQKLLKMNIVEDNEYLDNYVFLINHKSVNQIKGKTNFHHIISKYYYRDRNLPIDNSDSNLVSLYYKDHILAHYYLALCSLTDKDKAKNSLAIKFILNGQSVNDINIHEIDFDKFQSLYELGKAYNIDSTHTIEINHKISEKLCGRISLNKGKKKNNVKKSKQNPNAKNKLLSEYASKRVGEKKILFMEKHIPKTPN